MSAISKIKKYLKKANKLRRLGEVAPGVEFTVGVVGPESIEDVQEMIQKGGEGMTKGMQRLLKKLPKKTS